MSKIHCCLKLSEVPLHLYHITAGFLLLEKQGIIDLNIEKLKKGTKYSLPYNMMEVVINQEIKVLYDLNDGYDNLLLEGQNYITFMDNLLNRFDYCFKRSFSSKYNGRITNAHKIYPLGLNYMVTIPGNIAHIPAALDPKNEKIKKLVRMIPFSEYYNGQYKISSFEDNPIEDLNSNILFMARMWDVNGDQSMKLSSTKKEERAYINEVRAKCIRLCKKEFGKLFFGGVSPNDFSLKHYNDIVIQDKKLTKRNNYIKRVKASSICIATMGLHESIGWKFGEYVSASKAIVTEELHYELPGNFKNEQNYLDFKTPEDCINQIYRLISDDEFRYEMKRNNYKYYHNYVRPDRLVLNSLLTAI